MRNALWRSRCFSLVTSAALLLLAAAPAAAQIPAERRAVLAKAQVWRPTNVAAMNLRVGPTGPGAFAPRETIRCDYGGEDLGGRSPKFRCHLSPGDDVKVKFGARNGEVYGEVAATRLLWALGFGADRMYSVRVVCRGCPDSIGERGGSGERVIDTATIERRAGPELPAPGGRGWSWTELDLIDEREGAPRAQRDALKLLAVFLQHTDTKPEQQRLICLDDAVDAGVPCAQPFMMLNDVGLTFGRATLLNLNATSSMNHHEWANAPIWKYSTSCIGNLPRSLTGTLRDPAISEEGRQFLATLLQQLSDAQLRDLFDVARAEQRDAGSAPHSETATVAEWVDTFKQKRAAIVNRHCADDWSSQAPYLFKTTPNLWLQSWASPALTVGMNVVSLFGYLPFYLALTVLLALTVNVRAGASLLVLLVLTNVITDGAKIVVSYPRPDAVDRHVEALAPIGLVAEYSGHAHVAESLPAPANAIVERFAALASSTDADDAYGFPSGHVSDAIAFLCGLVFLFRWRGAWIAAALWIPLMAASRMYLGRHFLADVIGGLAAGLVATIVVVRGLNLQRLRDNTQRRVLVKTLATAAACAVFAMAASIPPVYEAGKLVGAAVALVLVSWTAPVDYDDAGGPVKVGRLGVAAAVFGCLWWVTTTPLLAHAVEATSTHAFIIGALPTAALIPAPMLLEQLLRRWID